MKRNNIYNRVFHKKEVCENKELMQVLKKQISNAPDFLKALENAKCLEIVLAIHKDLYASGFEHPNIGPCSYGMFRCKSISSMTPQQVFLGGIYGLNTYTIPVWEKYVDKPFGVNEFGIKEDTSLYEIILNQYKQHLISNVVAMYNNALYKLPILVKLGY